MMPTRGETFREQRRRLGMSQGQLARKVGTTQQHIYRIERDSVGETAFEDPIKRVLGLQSDKAVTEYRLAGDAAPNVQPEYKRDLPVFAALEESGALVVSSNPVAYDFRPAPLENAADAYELIIGDDMMSPEYKPGDKALVNPSVPPIPGEACVFYAQDEATGKRRVIVRTYLKATNAQWYVKQLRPCSNHTLSRKVWTVCHPIIGKFNRR